MISRLQKLIPLLFAAVIFFSSSGIYVAGKIKTMIHRETRMDCEEGEELITIRLSKQEFSALHWIGERDFIYNGSMYDIHSFAEADGDYLVTCELDHHETGIHAMLEKQIGHDHGTSKKHNMKGAVKLYDLAQSNIITALIANNSNLLLSLNITNAPGSAFLSNASPPPEA